MYGKIEKDKTRNEDRCERIVMKLIEGKMRGLYKRFGYVHICV